MKSFPLTGEKVKCIYYELNELEAKCWLIDYQIYGYVENKNMYDSYIGKGDTLIVAHVDHNTFDVKLIKI